jgi:ribosome-associated protein
MIKINNNLFIPEDELIFTASRSSGPGGQYVNKVSTRITLLFDIAGSPSLSAEQKRLIQAHLSTRISKTGVLRVIAQASRSQMVNKELARERFVELINQALHVNAPRRKTRVPAGVRQQRLDEKKHRARFKKWRARNVFPEE